MNYVKKPAVTMFQFWRCLACIRGTQYALMMMLVYFLCLSGCGFQTEWKHTDNSDVSDERNEQAKIAPEANRVSPTEEATMKNDDSLATATFGAGCFWCTEAVFQRLRGVDLVVSGYMGGETKNPTYREVCQGTTGHAEVIQVHYNPSKVQFEALLEVFWKTHDPTTLNRQGADVGTQYRSVVFYHSDEQMNLVQAYKRKLDDAGVFDDPIVTEISPASLFYAAEDYHQNYFNLNPHQGYCSFVIHPKIQKLESVFADKLKTDDPQ